MMDDGVRHNGGLKDKARDTGGRHGRQSPRGARRRLPRPSPVGRSLVLVLSGLLGCAAVLRWKNVILYGEIKIDPAKLKMRDP